MFARLHASNATQLIAFPAGAMLCNAMELERRSVDVRDDRIVGPTPFGVARALGLICPVSSA